MYRYIGQSLLLLSYIGLHVQCLLLCPVLIKKFHWMSRIQNLKKKWSSGSHTVPCRQWIGDRPGDTNSHFVHALKNGTICSVCCRTKVGPVSTHTRKFIVMLSLCWFISRYGAWHLTKQSLKGFSFYGFGYCSVSVVIGFFISFGSFEKKGLLFDVLFCLLRVSGCDLYEAITAVNSYFGFAMCAFALSTHFIGLLVFCVWVSWVRLQFIVQRKSRWVWYGSMATQVTEFHFKILCQEINYLHYANTLQRNTYWCIFMKQIKGRKLTEITFSTCFQNTYASFYTICKWLYWPWILVLKWWLLSHISAKSQSHF